MANGFYLEKGIDKEIAVELDCILDGKNYKNLSGKGSRSIEINGKNQRIDTFDRRIKAYVDVCKENGLEVDYKALCDSVLGNKYLDKNTKRQEEIFGLIGDYVVEDKYLARSTETKKSVLENIAESVISNKKQDKFFNYIVDLESQKGRYEIIELTDEIIELTDEIIELTDIVNKTKDIYKIDTPSLTNHIRQKSYGPECLAYSDTISFGSVAVAELDSMHFTENEEIQITNEVTEMLDNIVTETKIGVEDLREGLTKWYTEGFYGWDEKKYGIGPKDAIAQVEKAGYEWGIFRNLLADGKPEVYVVEREGKKFEFDTIDRARKSFDGVKYCKYEPDKLLLDPWRRKSNIIEQPTIDAIANEEIVPITTYKVEESFKAKTNRVINKIKNLFVPEIGKLEASFKI